MRTWLKRAAKTFLALAMMAGLGSTAQAVVTSTDSLTVTITPNAYYALDIDTSTMLTNLGNVDLGASTHTINPATVTVQSTYAMTDLKLQGGITSAGSAWTFDPLTSDTEPNSLATWAVFTDTSVTHNPIGSAGAFSGTAPGASNSDVVSASQQDVGTGGGFSDRFVLTNTATGYRSMEDIPAEAADAPGSRSKLWLKFRLPPSSADNSAQNITITLFAGVPNN